MGRDGDAKEEIRAWIFVASIALTKSG